MNFWVSGLRKESTHTGNVRFHGAHTDQNVQNRAFSFKMRKLRACKVISRLHIMQLPSLTPPSGRLWQALFPKAQEPQTPKLPCLLTTPAPASELRDTVCFSTATLQQPSSFFFFLILSMYSGLCVCVQVHPYMCVCVQARGQPQGLFLRSHITLFLFLEIQSLTRTQLGVPCPTSHTPLLSGCWGSTSGPHACWVSTFLTEPSLQCQ